MSGFDRERFDVLGVMVDAVSMSSAIARVESFIASSPRPEYITFTNVHAVMEARADESFRAVLNTAGMVCPDGMPLVWLGRWAGSRVQHVCGPDFMIQFCKRTVQPGYRHFFYGGAPGVAELLARRLQEQFPTLKVAGTYCPPFHELSRSEKANVIREINEASPDILWVGLGCPKQEKWMREFAGELQVKVLLGVGQAFDIHAGRLKQAPRFLRDHGFEWLYRLCSEPRRLWRRYLVTNVGFAIALLQSGV